MAYVNDIIAESVRKLGYREAKHLQIKSIKEFISGNDVFVSVPTGYGKTLCYACLPQVFDALCGHQSPYSTIVVISPLQALMPFIFLSFTSLNAFHAFITTYIYS